MTEAQTLEACLDWNAHNSPPLADTKVRDTVASIARAEARKQSQQSTASNASDDSHEPNQKERIILIGLEEELWHDKDGNTFATIDRDGHKEHFSCESKIYRQWLIPTYGDRYPVRLKDKTCPSVPSSLSVTEAISTLVAQAARGPEYQAAVRIAGHNESIYIDLGTPDWNVAEISAKGWKLLDWLSRSFRPTTGPPTLADT
jgi:hypothetical protein